MRTNPFQSHLDAIEQFLHKILPRSDEDPALLHRAMRYCAFPGGKRLRPILTLIAAETLGGRRNDALPAAAAVELVHTYSLIHDDLPAMDDAAMRRGKPSCHRKFDEATAILAGDALLTYAFEVIANCSRKPVVVPALVGELAKAIGSRGMVGGQCHDIAPKRGRSLSAISKINRLKTAALFAASARCGAISAGASQTAVQIMGRCGEAIGVAFQITDDILDGESGTDPAVRGMGRSMKNARGMVERARACLKNIPRVTTLIARYIDLIEERLNGVKSSRHNQ